MSLKFNRHFIVFILKFMMVRGEVNKASVNVLKSDFGCVPPEAWDLIKFQNQIVRNVCLKKDYQVAERPGGDNFSQVVMQFRETKVSNVDEMKKTITLDMKLLSIWEDPRIIANFSNIENWIGLPSVTTGDPRLIWDPFESLHFANLKERQHILDPVIIQDLILSSSYSENICLTTKICRQNATVIRSMIEWRITFACRFDFSAYPFDKHTCPFTMKSANIQVILHTNIKTQKKMKYDAEGFTIDMKPFADVPKYNPLNRKYVGNFGLNIQMKRQVQKYFFQYFLPCIAVVIASSFSFIIPLSAIPGRVALVVTQFLTLTNLFIHQMVSSSIIFSLNNHLTSKI